MKNVNLILTVVTVTVLCVTAYGQPVEINQAYVAQFSTNYASSGFPFVITQPGSYKVTSNLKVPAGLDGIDIRSNDVTLDLNGFTISGPVACTGVGLAVNCPNGTGVTIGIYSDIPYTNITVRNGSVVGFQSGVQ